jgi:pimeloyl-ACP methyl ester carboxylesterase
VFANSLLTDFKLWSLVLPWFIAKGYNILLLSQRGHGKSTLPPPPLGEQSDKRTVTIPSLASDIHHILHHLKIPTPIKSIIGVSQGGATSLAFAAQFPDEIQSIVVCDTGPRTPAGNNTAWEERIRLVGGDQLSGMKRLADVTVPRWFPLGSKVFSNENQGEGGKARAEWISSMIRETSVDGFEAGAGALSSYDTVSLGILDSPVQNVLLLAGGLDGNGKVGSSLGRFGDDWNERRRLGVGDIRGVEFVLVEGAGHLPMVDEPEAFCEVVDKFLGSF